MDHIYWPSTNLKKMPEKHSWSRSKPPKCLSFRDSIHLLHFWMLSGIYKHLFFRSSCDGFKSPQAASVQVLPLLMNLSKVNMTKCLWHNFLYFSSTRFHQQLKGRCENLKLLSRRETHTWVERLRRSELRELFDKLHSLLQSNPKPPRLHLLSMVSAISAVGIFFFFSFLNNATKN